MGLIILVMWIGALGVLGLPGVALSVVVAVRAQRTRAFWLGSTFAVVMSVLGQYVAICLPFVRKGAVSWDFVISAMFGWHLLAPALLAGLVGVIARGVRGAVPGGTVSGLLMSIPLSIGLAVPSMFVLPSLLGLRFEP